MTKKLTAILRLKLLVEKFEPKKLQIKVMSLIPDF